MASKDTTGMAAGRMAERGETFGTPDERFEAPKERKLYPYQRINELIDMVPSAETGPSVLGPMKDTARGLNGIMAILSGDYEFDQKGMIANVVDAGLGIGAAGVARGAIKSGVKNVPDQVNIFAAVDESKLLPAQKRAQTMIDNINPDQSGIPYTYGHSRTGSDGSVPWTPLDPDAPGPNYRKEAERWERTATTRTAGGQLMREIDDSTSVFKFDPNKEEFYKDGATHRLGDVLEHPELYAEYPELADIKVVTKAMPDKTTHGYYDARSNEMVLNSNASSFQNPAKLKQLVIHELQHGVSAIDSKRGLNPGLGANYDTFGLNKLRDVFRNAQIYRGQKISDLAKQPGWEMKHVKILKDLVTTYRVMDDILKQTTGIDTDQFVDVIDNVISEYKRLGRDPSNVSEAALFSTMLNKYKISSPAFTSMLNTFKWEMYKRSQGEVIAREAEIRTDFDANYRRFVTPRLTDEPSRGVEGTLLQDEYK